MRQTRTLIPGLAVLVVLSGCGDRATAGGGGDSSSAKTANESTARQTAPTPQEPEKNVKPNESGAPEQSPSAEASSLRQHPGLFDPTKANEVAPPTFKVKFETTKGNIVIAVTRSLSPNGADRFYNLVNVGFLGKK